MPEGTYGLGIEVAEDRTIAVGALGDLRFERGSYIYVGSAFGPGGFSRIDRHRELAAGERDARHWHIDYLLGDSAVSLTAVGKVVDADRECSIASELPGDPVDRFGASDCACGSHLRSIPADRDLTAVLAKAYDSVENR